MAEFAGRPFSEFKPALADLAVAELAPITRRMTELIADPAEIDRLLGDGAEKRRGDRRADPRAAPTTSSGWCGAGDVVPIART